MPLSVTATIIMIVTAAICTFFTRLLPFMLFGGKKEVPSSIRYLGKILPPAIIATLIIYCLKEVHITLFPSGIPEFIAIAIVVFLHLWKRNNLLSIGVGTIAYMLMVQNMF